MSEMRRRKRKKKPALILGSFAAAAMLGLVLNAAFPADNGLRDHVTAWLEKNNIEHG